MGKQVKVLKNQPKVAPKLALVLSRNLNAVLFIDNGVVLESGDAKQLIRNPSQERTRQFLNKLRGQNASAD